MHNPQEIPPAYQNTAITANWDFRRQAFSNLLHMGHCAPTVLKTILDIQLVEKEWLVRLSAGMPGGIGNTGFECGGITSPLVLMGIKFGLHQTDAELPAIFDKGHALYQSFIACHKTYKCIEIRQKDHFPRHCIMPVLMSPELFRAANNGDSQESISPASRASYSRLYNTMVENNFHCSQSVLRHLGYIEEENRELFDAMSAFMGGTLFLGKTCSAFTAGVMAIGYQTGEIENSIPRVIRLLGIMTVGGNAFDENINNFNSSMNRGYKLSRWFTKEFSSTQCQAITQCDFSSPEGVDNYINRNCILRCEQIAEKVAARVQTMISA